MEKESNNLYKNFTFIKTGIRLDLLTQILLQYIFCAKHAEHK